MTDSKIGGCKRGKSIHSNLRDSCCISDSFQKWGMTFWGHHWLKRYICKGAFHLWSLQRKDLEKQWPDPSCWGQSSCLWPNSSKLGSATGWHGYLVNEAEDWVLWHEMPVWNLKSTRAELGEHVDNNWMSFPHQFPLCCIYWDSLLNIAFHSLNSITKPILKIKI